MTGYGRSANKSYFHYRVEKFNGDEKELEKYYMTMQDIKDDFGISRHSISNMLKNPNKISKKYKGLKVFRDYRPAIKLVQISQENI
jgi:predicted DNA-binding protein YlxM (UPF0122 family)